LVIGAHIKGKNSFMNVANLQSYCWK